MPNKPHPDHEQLGARVPREVASELREVAEEAGVRTGEVVARALRDWLRRYRTERAARRGVSARRIIDRKVKLGRGASSYGAA